MLIRRLLYWSNFVVVRWQLLLTAFSFWLIWHWLNGHYTDKEMAAWKVVITFLPVLGKTFLYVAAGSIVTAIIAWGFFIYRVRSGKISVQLSVGEGEQAEAGLVPVTVTLKHALRPFLGSVKARLVFSGMRLSGAIVLDENVHDKGSLVRKAVRGKSRTMLHDRGIYDVEEVQLLFCDVLRLVALPFTLHASKQLYTLPKELQEIKVRAHPNTTEEQTHRIEIPKRVEGEYLNYKDFEAGDDVRRIVWKIYARSGELVVRIPETMDPYASHLVFYASFYNSISEAMSGVFETELLNVYKDKVRNLFEALEKNGFEMRLPHDQETPKLQGMGDKKNELFHIASAAWQKDTRPDEFVQVRKAAFVCVSSLTPARELYTLFGNLPQNVPVVAVKMSDAISSPFSMKFRDLFFIPEKDSNRKLSRSWILSPLYGRLKQNERELSALFRQRGNAYLVSAYGKA